MKGTVVDAVALRMQPGDDVATALEDLDPGRAFAVDGRRFALSEAVPFGHKFALRGVAAGETVEKYGHVIGRAGEAIEPGDWVHVHNLDSTRGRGDVAGGERA